VRSVLARTTYHGEVIWNKTRKTMQGQKDVTKRAASEWITVINEDLRIIDENCG
jgi:hypothetical protein